MESWLSFLGNTRGIAQRFPKTPIVNLDIGGGTTNTALGIDDNVVATGSYFIGARHVRLNSEGQILGLTPVGARLFTGAKLGLPAIGDFCSAQSLKILITYQIDLLESSLFAPEKLEDIFIDQRWFPLRPVPKNALFTLSGGVGELVYDLAENPDRVQHFGDLGVAMAQEILQRDLWRKIMTAPSSSQLLVPLAQGHATLLGVTLNQRQTSGASNFHNSLVSLPLESVPLMGTLDARSTRTSAAAIFATPLSRDAHFAIKIAGCIDDAKSVKKTANLLEQLLVERSSSATLVLICQKNIAKSLGGYLSQWGQNPRPVIILDEIPILPPFGVLNIWQKGSQFHIELLRYTHDDTSATE